MGIRETTSDSTRTTQLIEVFSTSSLASFSLLYTITSRKIWRINQKFPFGKKGNQYSKKKTSTSTTPTIPTFLL